MRTQLFWIEGPWRGKLAIMPRPRGDDWLQDEIRSWQQCGVNVVVSMLTQDEQTELGLDDEASLCRDIGIEFVSFPIVDRAVPSSTQTFSALVAKLGAKLAEGKNVAVHCRQGIGRAGLIAVCVLVHVGVETSAAVERVSSARGCTVPETPEQRQWIEDFSKSLAGTS